MKTLTFALLFFLTGIIQNVSISQEYDLFNTSSCATEIPSGENNYSALRGGYYKPHRSDIGGDPFNDRYFPILLVFVQFYEDSPDNSELNIWPAGQPPAYMSSLITDERQSGSNWWDLYNDYEVSDYWHEVSRGKFHTLGNAYSIILPHTEGWYLQNYPNDPITGSNSARVGKINKDIYDRLKLQIIDEEWEFYDRWTGDSPGNFTWGTDGKLDMIYVTYRTGQAGTLLTHAYGWVPLGNAQGETSQGYEVYSNSSGSYKIYIDGHSGVDGSGLVVTGKGGIPTRETFLLTMAHEHGHYLYGGDHITYSKMAYGAGNEQSLSPWDMVKLNYIVPKSVNYNNPVHILGDYSSRGGTAGTTGEILEIFGNNNELFLIANRRKVSKWDRRMAGDTLAFDEKNFLNPNVNPEIGKGLYIYHIRDGYNYDSDNKMDLECADGLWNWQQAGTSSPAWDPNTTHSTFKRVTPSYDNDFYFSGGCNNRDGMSVFCNSSQSWYSVGKAHAYNPYVSGVDRLNTNDENYWYSLEFYGDRWDAWNVGYNEIFSPWSSPNTKDENNNQTGIYIWYKALNSSTNEATLEIYKVGQNGETETTILEKTPPSRPMGVKVGEYYPGGAVCHPKVEWVHNMEPDMIRSTGGGIGTSNVKRYKIYRSSTNSMSSVPYNYTHIATVDIDPNTSPSYTDLTINKFTCESLEGDPNAVPFPVRYKIKAVDVYDDESVYSDFASTEGIFDDGTGKEEEGGDNISVTGSELPTVFSLNQNYPNPFNPTTNIQFDIPTPEFVTLKIYDISGKEVATLVNEYRNVGSFVIGFNASSLSSGIYFYKIIAGSFIETKKMMLIK
ncbi:MAG TPA: T9SS type A sorting domain-containing protein [Ignavibacteria bacterium]|nr:T9SS type A sorting domain-containing protein [Ignavibacteria bacterium]